MDRLLESLKLLVVGGENKDCFSHYVWEGEELHGRDSELIFTVADRLGYDVKFEPYPWSRGIRMAEDGQLVGVLHFGRVKKAGNTP